MKFTEKYSNLIPNDLPDIFVTVSSDSELKQFICEVTIFLCLKEKSNVFPEQLYPGLNRNTSKDPARSDIPYRSLF